MDVGGKVAIVTGGASGIGRGVVEKLLEKGAQLVAVFDFNELLGKSTTSELAVKFGNDRVKFCRVDVSSEERLRNAIKGVYEVHNRLDIMVNNAGICDETKVTETILTNVLGVMYGTHIAAEYMSKRRGGNGGVVLNTSSIAACWAVGAPVYSSSKYAVVGFSRNLPIGNEDFKPAGGIRAGCICPSGVDTPLLRGFLEKNPKSGGGERNRLTVQAVVEAFMKVIEDESINGHVLRVSPGTGIEFQPYEKTEDLLKRFRIFKNPDLILGQQYTV